MNLDNTRGGDLRPFRSYFEDGCLCVLDGTLQKAEQNMTDGEALDYYIANCKCSRHPNASEGKPLFLANGTQGRYAVLDNRFGSIASQVQQALRMDVHSIAFMGPDFDDDDVALVRSAGLRLL